MIDTQKLKDAITEAMQVSLHFLRHNGQKPEIQTQLQEALQATYQHYGSPGYYLPDILAGLERWRVALDPYTEEKAVGAVTCIDEARNMLEAWLREGGGANGQSMPGVKVTDSRQAFPIREEDAKPTLEEEREKVRISPLSPVPEAELEDAIPKGRIGAPGASQQKDGYSGARFDVSPESFAAGVDEYKRREDARVREILQPDSPDAMLELGLALINELQEGTTGLTAMSTEEINKRFAGLRNLLKDVDGGAGTPPPSVRTNVVGAVTYQGGDGTLYLIDPRLPLPGDFEPPVGISVILEEQGTAPPSRTDIAGDLLDELEKGVRYGYDNEEQKLSAFDRLTSLRTLILELEEDYRHAQIRERRHEERLEQVIAFVFRRGALLKTIPTNTAAAFRFILKLAFGEDSTGEPITGAELEGARNLAKEEAVNKPEEELTGKMPDGMRKRGLAQIELLSSLLYELHPEDAGDVGEETAAREAAELKRAREAVEWLRSVFIYHIPDACPPSQLGRINRAAFDAVTAYMANPLASGSKGRLADALRDIQEMSKPEPTLEGNPPRFEVTEPLNSIHSLDALERLNNLYAALWEGNAERNIFNSLAELNTIREALLYLDRSGGA